MGRLYGIEVVLHSGDNVDKRETKEILKGKEIKHYSIVEAGDDLAIYVSDADSLTFDDNLADWEEALEGMVKAGEIVDWAYL
jgi:hypothetical protein